MGGHIYGMVVDAESGKIIFDVTVENDPEYITGLEVIMPFKGTGVYYAHGPQGQHKIQVTHNTGEYEKANFTVWLTEDHHPLERHVYLSLSENQQSKIEESISQKA